MHYFDIVNLDRYQVVLGTPFLKQHGVILNYMGSRSFKLGDRWFPIRERNLQSLCLMGEEAQA